MKQRLLAIFLSLTLMLSLVPSAWAVENEESSQETVVEEPETELIEGLQARINALPDAAALAEMDEDALNAVYNEVQTIYDALDALSTEEVEALELTPLETAAAFFTEQVAPLDVSAGIVISENMTWDTATKLTKNLTVNSGVTLTIGAQVTISGNVTVSGGGTIKRGERFADYMIVVPEGSTLTLENITVDGGAVWSGNDDAPLKHGTTNNGIVATSAMIYNFGELLVTDGAVLQNNENTTDSGKIATKDETTGEYTYPTVEDKVQFGGAVLNGGEMRIAGGSIQNNSVAWRGAGVASYGIIEMTGGTVQGNFTKKEYGDGGAFYLHGAKNTSEEGSAYCTISGGQFTANKAGGAGGAVCADGQSILNVSRGNFENNAATTTGGGINVYSSILNMSASTISGNSADRGGGGLNLIMGSKATITGGFITTNKATNGGGIQVADSSELDASNLVIEKNEATSSGGGILAPGAKNKAYRISLNDVSVKDNKAGTGSGNGGVGGGICASRAWQEESSTGTLTLMNSKITGNQGITGGGIYLDADITATMDGGEISGNSAISTGQSSGGGIWVKGTFTLNSGKISNNVKDGPWNGGAGAFVSGTFTMNGGEVSGNIDTCTEEETRTIGGGAFYVMGGTLNILGGSIIGNASYRRGAITFHYGPYARGTVNITGGTITGNYCTSGYGSAGGAIYMPTAVKSASDTIFDQTVNISGNPVITGNYKGAVIASNEGVYTINTANATTENNIYLSLNQKYSSNTDAVPSDYADRQTIVLGELTNGASIGVTTETSPAEGRKVQITTAETDTGYYKDAAQYFIPDAADVIAQANEGKYVELAYTADHYYKVTLDLSHASVSTGSPTTMVKNGESCTITIKADEGYTLPEVTKDGVTYDCNNDKTAATVTVTPTANINITIAAIPKPTNADLAKGLVTVKCLNPVPHNDVQYGLNAAVAANKYATELVSATEYSVTYDADAFAVNGHSLYSAKTLNWTLTYDGSKWNLKSKTSGVDDVVLVTHAPTTLNEVTEFIDGRTDVIKTSCVNGETATCAYGLMVAFVNKDHVVSVEQEKDSSGEPIPGSYIATLKMDQFAETCAKACNDKSFADSPRTHDVLSQNPVQWRFKVTQAEVSTDAGAEKQYVWSAEPVEAGKDDVCQVAHHVVLTFSYDQYGVTVDNTKVEYKYNTREITNNEVPTPTREGYTFVQWLDADGKAFDPTANVTEDHTYNNIEWKPIEYRVIFDANAGGKTVTGTMEDQVFTYDVEAKLNANTFACTDEKNGVQLYAFGGWNTEADGSGTAYTDEQEVSNLTAESEGEITLYAQWQHVTKKLTYVSAQGDAPDAADVDIFSEVVVANAPAGFDETKYIFKGWRSNVAVGYEVMQPGDKFVMPNTDVTLTAVWEEIVPVAKHTVTYQIDSMQSKDGIYEVGSTVHVMRDNPTKSGYTFLYWRSSHEGKLLRRGDTFEMPNTNVTLTAQWQKDPTEYTVQFLVDGRPIGQETGIAGSFITLKPAQTKTGFTFVGWQSSVGEGKIYPANSRFEIPATTVKMTAVWQADPTTYTVTYALNGGEGTAPTAAQYVADAFVTVTDETFTKEGFIFAGWRSSFGGTVYQANDTFQMPGTNVTLTAQWQPVEKTYTVSTSIDGTVTQIVDGKKANEIYTIAVDDPTKDGHTFTGWLLSSTGTVVHNGDTFNMPAGNVVLTAQWEKEAESYTVTYKNGEASESAGSYKAGEWVNVKEAPAAAAGQTFKGWESNTGETYQPGKQFKMPDTNVVLTAKWIANTYTITWMGADGELMQTTVQHGETPVYSGATPTKDATVDKTYTFKGWNPEITEATEDTTYTAQFEETTRTYTVKFFNADGTLLESKQVEYGTVPKLGCTPTLEGNSQYSYTFKTWSPKLAPVTGDAEYCATYTKTVNKYTVTWIIDGDSTEETYEYGKMPAHADPVKAATDDTVYTFKGWTPALSIVTGNVTYTAQFDAITKHTVSYELAGGTPAIDSAKYAAGDVVTTPATVPTKTGYVFTGWLVSFENKTVNAYGSFTMPNTDVTLTAQWRVAITGNVYIPAMNPEHGTHEEPYSAQLTAKKDNATGDPVTAGDVQFVLVDANGHADTSRNIGHDLKLNADGSITGTANGAGEVTFRVRLANAAGDFVSDSFEFTIVIDKASRICTSVTMEGWTYGDKPNKPVVTLSKTEGTESYTYFYKVKGTDDSTYTTEVPVNAGDYTVKVVVAESANYKSCEGTADFTIRKALITSVDPVVTAPVACAAAQTTIADGNGYTGTITWTPAPVDGKFDYATEYTAAVVLTPDSNHYFAANTKAEGWSVSYDADSGKLTLTHKFEKTELGKIETPVIRPNGGRFTDRQTVKITCATEGTVIHYTTDGTTPTASSSVYDGVFTITETTTVKAIAVKEKYLDSEVASATFTKYTPRPSTGGATVIPTPSKTELKFNTADHFAYVNGYPDGTVKPTGDVTRAEVAAILYRVMDADCVKTYETTRCSFSDVVRGDWFNTYVATLENAGVIVDTRTNGKFRPNEAITRAELAAMLAQFADIKSAANSFNDVSARHWASDEIAVCAKMGWINGYPDGSFRPDATITRAEMMAMINRALDRTPKSVSDLLSGMKTWSDNANTGAWYYLDVQEATNSHTYTKSGTHETWKKLH